jgi:CheY-like chemotaxis protein
MEQRESGGVPQDVDDGLPVRGADGLEATAGPVPRRAVMIMVAERDPVTIDLERHLQEALNCVAYVVLDGRTAVREAAAAQPDLIVVDVILPGRSGLHVCRDLKDEPSTSTIPVAVFSILNVRRRALEAGADAFFLKPAEQPALLRFVADTLARTPGAREPERAE